MFETTALDTAALEARIAVGLQEALGYEVATFIRTEAELARISAHEAFPQSQLDAAQALNIAFLDRPLDVESLRRLMALKTAIDDFATHEREIYWLCRKKQSESTFSNAVLEKTLRQAVNPPRGKHGSEDGGKVRPGRGATLSVTHEIGAQIQNRIDLPFTTTYNQVS